MLLPFIIIAAITVAGALAAMMLRNLVHCVLALALVFAGLAALYLELGAQFAGLAQVLIYVGAVAILTVFAILLTRSEEPASEPVVSTGWPLSVLIASSVFAVLAWAIVHSGVSRQALPREPRVLTVDIGIALMNHYVVPLEVAALLLTTATVGAVIVAMYERRGAR